ncbi:MAG: hypothetical protein FJ095_02075, partial [Deltaproteobacteria bacterium]|nr:hypothetical protein [Deltaproteobacteria bacterium]
MTSPHASDDDSAPTLDAGLVQRGVRLRRVAPALLLAGLAATASRAMAQPVPPRLSDGLALPSQNPVSLLSTTATLINPANLAFLRGPELRGTWIETPDASTSPLRGYAFGAAVPFFNLATGLHVDWMTPPPSAALPLGLSGAPANATWLRWGMAARLADGLAVGNTFAWSSSRRPELDGFFSVSSGLTYRPFTFLGASVMARDWNAPLNEAGVELTPSVDL